MANDIVSDFKLSVLNSQDAEAIFGGTTDDIIAAADKNGLVEKLPHRKVLCRSEQDR